MFQVFRILIIRFTFKLAIRTIFNSDNSFSYSLRTGKTVVKEKTTEDHKLFREGTRNENLFSVANALVREKWDFLYISQVIEMLAEKEGK